MLDRPDAGGDEEGGRDEHQEPVDRRTSGSGRQSRHLPGDAPRRRSPARERGSAAPTPCCRAPSAGEPPSRRGTGRWPPPARLHPVPARPPSSSPRSVPSVTSRRLEVAVVLAHDDHRAPCRCEGPPRRARTRRDTVGPATCRRSSIPGTSLPPLLSTSKRACSVRVLALICGKDLLHLADRRLARHRPEAPL